MRFSYWTLETLRWGVVMPSGRRMPRASETFSELKAWNKRRMIFQPELGVSEKFIS